MKTYTVWMAGLVVAVVMLSGSAFAGQTQAERERALRHRADPENALGWQVRPALETGSLPAGDAKQMKSEDVAEAGVPIVEIGGRVYRIGIDTP